MKYLVIAALVALSATDAEACLAGRARGRSVSRARTVTTTQNVQTHSYVPTVKQIERTILVPEVRTVMVPKKIVENVTINVPVVTSTPVTTSRTVERGRVRGLLAAPLGLLPCPNCR